MISFQGVIPDWPHGLVLPEAERRRWEVTGIRRAMLDDTWQPIAAQYVWTCLDPSLQMLRGPVYPTVNLFASVVDQLAIMYPAVLTHPAAEVPADVPFFDQGWAWLRYLVGLREVLVAIEYRPASIVAPAGVYYRVVPPDRVVVKCLPGTDQPVYLQEAREREIDGRCSWTWDVWDLRDARRPVFRVLDAALEEDLTAAALPPGDPLLTGYPYRWESGWPMLPFTLYHARATGATWDPCYWSSLVNASLEDALRRHFLEHALKDASYAQRYTMDAELDVSRTVEAAAGTAAITVSDPTSVVRLRSTNTRQGSVGQWARPVDLQQMSEAIDAQNRAALVAIGLNPADVQDKSSSSGYAIELRRDVQLAVAEQHEPGLRRGDQDRLARTCQILNLFEGRGLPVDGWTVSYFGLDSRRPRAVITPEDEMALELGLISRSDLLRRDDPSMTEDEARKRIAQNLEEERAYGKSTDAPDPGAGAGGNDPTRDPGAEPGESAAPADAGG